MDKTQVYLFQRLSKLFIRKGLWGNGTMISEYDTMLSGIQMCRPNIAYLSDEQIESTKREQDVIPEFVIEIISDNDSINQVEKKIVEYYKVGVSVVWLVMPEEKSVHVYTARKTVTICTEDNICSANPILPDFKISVNELLD